MLIEILVHFTDTHRETRVASKRAVQSWLRQKGISNVVDGFRDVSHLAPDEDLSSDDALADEDDLDILIYAESAEGSASICAGLKNEFDSHLCLTLREICDTGWQHAWKDREFPLHAGRFVLDQVPAASSPLKPGRKPSHSILLHPGTAFGDGRHATTIACLRALSEMPQPAASAWFLDVGTGNGVLAIAAARLGFTNIVGTDIDEDILADAERNMMTNGVKALLIKSSVIPANPSEPYDAIAANVLYPELFRLLPQMAACLAPKGTIWLAGFTEDRTSDFDAAAHTVGLIRTGKWIERGWACLAYLSQE